MCVCVCGQCLPVVRVYSNNEEIPGVVYDGCSPTALSKAGQTLNSSTAHCFLICYSNKAIKECDYFDHFVELLLTIKYILHINRWCVFSCVYM